MPLLRYFVFVGGALAALLIAADAWLPKVAASADRVDIDRSIIRIQSKQAMAGPIVYGTSGVEPTPVAALTTTADQAHGKSQAATIESVAPQPVVPTLQVPAVQASTQQASAQQASTQQAPATEALAQMPASVKPKKNGRPRQIAKGSSRQLIAASAQARPWGFPSNF